MPTHMTLSGHEIEHDPPPRAVAAFLAKLRAMVADDAVHEQAMIGFAYGPDNPLLDHSLFAGRGAVTKETLADPLYHVTADLLARKHAAVRGIDVEAIAAQHTLSVAEAAERLGVHASAVRQAIASRRLPSWVKDGKYYLRPAAVDAFKIGNRGPKPASAGEPLKVRVGNHEGLSFRFKALGGLSKVQRPELNIVEAELLRWSRVAVIAGGQGKHRFFELVPSDEEHELRVGTFYVLGKLAIASKVNNPRAAREAWEAFEPS
jgi:excisionase family DNA binding protein